MPRCLPAHRLALPRRAGLARGRRGPRGVHRGIGRSGPRYPESDTGFLSLARALHELVHLVGGRAQLAPLWSAYGIGVQAGSASVTHNDAVYLIDRRGRERVLLHSEDLAGNLVEDLRSLLRAGD